MKNIDYYNPAITFSYLTDDILWEEVFNDKYPVDLSQPSLGYIEFPKFFEVETLYLDTKRGYRKNRKMLRPKDYFFLATAKERYHAFRCLCHFLNRYSRPFRDCVIHIPPHCGVIEREDYSPKDFYYKTPQLPVLNKEGNMLRVTMPEEIMPEIPEIYSYYHGREIQDRNINWIDFPFISFYGFLLQY